MCTRDDLATAQWCGKIHARPVVDRISTPVARTKYKGEGICLGAWVTGTGRYNTWGESFTLPEPGQVWAQSPQGRGYWWVATPTGFVHMHDSLMTVVGQAGTDSMFFDDELTA